MKWNFRMKLPSSCLKRIFRAYVEELTVSKKHGDGIKYVGLIDIYDSNLNAL